MHRTQQERSLIAWGVALLLLAAGCAGRSESSVTPLPGSEETDTSNTGGNPAPTFVERSSSSQYITEQVTEIVLFSQGLRAGIPGMPPEFFPIFPNSAPLLARTLPPTAVLEGEAERSSDICTEGTETWFDEAGNEHTILSECYDRETGIYTLTIEVVVADPAAPRASFVQTIGIDTNFTQEREDDAVIRYTEEIRFRDGSRGEEESLDLDEPADGNLFTGKLRILHRRNHVADEELERSTFTIDILLNAPETSTDDEILWIESRRFFSEAREIDTQLTPADPFPAGERPPAGTFSWRYTAASGPLRSLTSLTRFHEDGSAHSEQEARFSDGTTATRTIEDSGMGEIHLESVDRDGTILIGVLDRNAKSYRFVTTPPQGAAYVRIEEIGSYFHDKEGKLHGESRRTRFTSEEEGITQFYAFLRDEDRTTIRVTGDPRQGGEGLITVETMEGVTLHSGTWVEADGTTILLSTRQFLDGAAVQTTTLDDPATLESPDARGDIFFAPDGSGTGTITRYGATGGTTVYHVE
ncbi:MAG: hypothetical protein D6812_08370, partial [Deltaproteobacteria bacterium]